VKRATFVGTIGFLLLLVGGAALLQPSQARAASPPPPAVFAEGKRYFDQTGHYVRGPFLEFFNTYGGLRIFGYPQTELFYDARIGLWVQIFDNARMEWHPENPDPYKVQLSLLGDILGHSQPPLPGSRRPANSRFRRFFPETGHTLSFAFLEFYDRNGGLDVFGYPISEPMTEGEYIVQYFQRMRMEWHPERARDDQVVVGALGREYIDRYGVPPQSRARQPRSLVPEQRDETGRGEEPTLRVYAMVRYPVIPSHEMQTIFVYVTDGQREAVEGAGVAAIVHYPSGDDSLTFPPTDQRGITEMTFLLPPTPPGRRVIVEVTVNYWGTLASTETFFSPW